MKPAPKHLTTIPTPRVPARHGHDEMNFAEFPLVLLAKRVPAGMDSIEYQDDYPDAKGKLITRKVTISGAGKYGLPTAHDEDVLIALLYLTLLDKQKLQADEDSTAADAANKRTIYFTRPQLLQILGWPDTGDNYERLKKSLRRWKGVTIVYENWAFLTSNGERHRTDETGFSLLDNYELADGRSRARSRWPLRFRSRNFRSSGRCAPSPGTRSHSPASRAATSRHSTSTDSSACPRLPPKEPSDTSTRTCPPPGRRNTTSSALLASMSVSVPSTSQADCARTCSKPSSNRWNRRTS
jgi:hypothetical protein